MSPLQATMCTYYVGAPGGSAFQNAAEQFQIAQGFFSDILNAQLVIFSTIVAALVALYFLFNQKVTREHIRLETKLLFTELQSDIDAKFEERNAALEAQFNAAILQHESIIGDLRGQTYRSLGQFWEREGKFSSAFIWWMRATSAFTKVNNERLTRIALNHARICIENIQHSSNLSSSLIGEYQKAIADTDSRFDLEKGMLDSAIKTVLSQKT